MTQITAEGARNLSIDNSKERLPKIYDRIREVASKDEERLLEISVKGAQTRQSVIKELEKLGYKVTVIEGPVIHIEW